MNDRHKFTGRLHRSPDRRDPSSRELLLRRIRSEFVEMPCLRLTGPQARRLFHLTTDVCERVLATLVRDNVLICDIDGRYKISGTQMSTDRLESPPLAGQSPRAS